MTRPDDRRRTSRHDPATDAVAARRADAERGPSGARRAPQRAATAGGARRVERRRDLHAYYGDNHAVKGVDLDFAANQVTAMIGPSGCGKSTLVRCINRMHEEIPGARAEGDVTLDDADIYGPASTSSPCAARSAWSSRSPTRSRRCRSSTTSPPACG